MAESSNLANEAFGDRPMPAIVDWLGPDDQSCSLGSPSTPVNFIVELEGPSNSVLFLLQIDVDLRTKAANMDMCLFLRIRPDQVCSLALDEPPQPSTDPNVRPDSRPLLAFRDDCSHGLSRPGT